VARDADAATIRAAYRRRARQHHPDHVHWTGAGADEMATINEAYRVLGDPSRRAVYDRGLDGRAPSTAGANARGAASRAPGYATDGTAASPARSSQLDRTPARIPWRLMATFAVIGTIAVVIGAIFVDPPGEESPDGILRSGSCVTIEANGDAREVRCTGDDDLVVEQLVPIGARCPGGTQPYRDRLGLGTACVVGPG
jgi:DnaJ domain